MFGMSMPEILLILAVALIVIGPKKLPDLARSLGRGFREFKQATRELKESVDLDPGMKSIRNAFDGIDEEVRDAVRGKPGANAPTSGGDAEPERSEAHPAPGDDRAEGEDAGYQEALKRVQQAFGEKDTEPEPKESPDPSQNGDAGGGAPAGDASEGPRNA